MWISRGRIFLPFPTQTHTHTHFQPLILTDTYILADTVAVGYSSQLWQSSSLLFLLLVSLSGSTACVCIAGVCMCGCVVSASHCTKDATSGSQVSQILSSLPFPSASVSFSLICSLSIVTSLSFHLLFFLPVCLSVCLWAHSGCCLSPSASFLLCVTPSRLAFSLSLSLSLLTVCLSTYLPICLSACVLNSKCKCITEAEAPDIPIITAFSKVQPKYHNKWLGRVGGC